MRYTVPFLFLPQGKTANFECLNEEENQVYGDDNLEELGTEDKPIDAAAIKEVVQRIDEKLAVESTNKPLKKAKRIIKKDYLLRMQKYEQQEYY